MIELDKATKQLLEAQFGLASMTQLRDGGMSRSMLRTRVRHDWRFVLPGVIATSALRLTQRQRLVAGWLYAGPDAVVTSTTAARWRGVENASDDGRTRLFVPLRHTVMPNPAVLVRRSQRPDPARRSGAGVVMASPARAVADAAREALGRRQASAIVVQAVQKDVVTLEELLHELEDGPRCGASWLREAIDVAASAAWSIPEHDVLERLRGCGRFPVVWANPSLRASDGTRLPIPDVWLDDVALAIQVHSRQHHFAMQEWERTLTGDGIFAEYGIPVIAFTPRMIRDEPDRVVARIVRAHEALLHRPRPDVTAVPRNP